MTSRERVHRCLRFEHPDHMPHDLWTIPWADKNRPEVVAELRRRWPSDFCRAPTVYRPSPVRKGEPYEIGEAVDEWGCRFVNIQEGVHGEVKEPIVQDLAEWRSVVRPPFEMLPDNEGAARDLIAWEAEQEDRFMFGDCCPRPWERYQFLRGTENAMMDMMDQSRNVKGLLTTIHEYFLRECEFWASTAVDALTFMDDWGSQSALLIPPSIWREVFKPMYRDYCDIARSHDKAIFMHSDGYIQEVYPDLIEIGVTAINSQLFCMDMAELARIGKGKITFWGEIDRQHVLPSPDPQRGRDAVRKVARHLYDPAGGIIAQFELSPGSNGPTAIAIFEEWDRVEEDARAGRPL